MNAARDLTRITACLLVLLSLFNAALGQDKFEKQTSPIVEEGKLLYRSEMASWYGTDLFVEQFNDREKIGGYFSYSEKDLNKCIFFSKGVSPEVIGTITFDSTYNAKKARVDLTVRNFTVLESSLFAIRNNALDAINVDTIFRTYKNTNLNLIPLISGNEKKVYVLTGPENSGVVIFGNDYLLTFDGDNKVKSKKQLHRNIIPVHYDEPQQDSSKVIGGVHSHLPETGDFITPTDICTLMLYEKIAKWETYTVVSAKYISIWNCKANELSVIATNDARMIEKDQKKRHK